MPCHQPHGDDHCKYQAVSLALALAHWEDEGRNDFPLLEDRHFQCVYGRLLNSLKNRVSCVFAQTRPCWEIPEDDLVTGGVAKLARKRIRQRLIDEAELVRQQPPLWKIGPQHTCVDGERAAAAAQQDMLDEAARSALPTVRHLVVATAPIREVPPMPAAFAPDERGPTTVVEILEAMTDPESPVGLANRRAWVTPRGVEERSYVDLTKGMHAVRRPPELFAAVAFYNGWQFPWSIRALESSPELCRAMGITFPQSEQLQAAGAALRQTRVRWGNILQSEEINQLEAARHIESNLTGSTPDAVEEAGGAREAYGDIRRNQIDPQ